MGKPIDIESLETIARAATPGPWKAELDVFAPDTGIEATVSDINIDMLAILNLEIEDKRNEDGTANREYWQRARESQGLKDARHIAAFSPGVALVILAEIKHLRSRVKAADALAEACVVLDNMWRRCLPCKGQWRDDDPAQHDKKCPVIVYAATGAPARDCKTCGQSFVPSGVFEERLQARGSTTKVCPACVLDRIKNFPDKEPA